MTGQPSVVFDEMGIPGTGEGLALRERFTALLDGPPGNVLLLGENGTGRSLGLHLFASRAAEAGQSVLERQGQLWRFTRDGGETLSRELWPLLVDLKSEGSTLVVDDLDDLDSKSQAQLLEALSRPRPGGKLCLAASAHCSLPRLAVTGGFSEALWHSFDPQHTLLLPPLRSDPTQIPHLARRLVKQMARKFSLETPHLHSKTVLHLQAYPWPGNVRQLHQVLERAVLGCTDGELGVADLPAWLLDGDEYGLLRAARASMSLEDLERCYIEIVLKLVGGHRCKAAAILDINRKTLATKIQRHSIPLTASPTERSKSTME